MSLVLPVLFHWSPVERRKQIIRHGLKPTCADGRLDGEGDEHAEIIRAVCLGTSPSHAWWLSGDVVADPGSVWDLWQVPLDEHDEVHPLPFFGHRLQEVRVRNRIPKRRIWLVGQRTV